MYIDTHCHISKNDYEDINLLVTENRKNQVDTVVVSGCDKESIFEVIKISEDYEDMLLTIGFHPSEADIVSEEDLILLNNLIVTYKNKIIGIGEIGLDYHYGKENMELQKELFRKQMKIASEVKLPVVIHSRDATQDTISILKEFPDVHGIIHCFTGSIETALEYIKIGYKIGIGGVVTFKNSNLFKVVEVIGIDNIVLETDAPYLAPEPVRGKKNSSKNLVYIAKRVSEILKISLEEVAEKTSLNASILFDLQ